MLAKGGPNADFASVLDSAVVHSEATKDEDGKNATPDQDPCMKDVDGVKPEMVGAEEEPKNGALASGEQVDIYEFRNIGFLLQYFAVGIIYGGLPATIYGFFLGFLNVPGYVYATAAVVTTMPWSFKLFFGFLNDCFPILGYRRKPYMVLGWTLCFLTLLVLGTKPLPKPYFCVAPDGNFDKDQICNEEARWAGGEFACLMCLAALGYVVADVAADGLMVEFAQREPQEKRGTTQTTIYLVRTIGSIVATAVVGIGMNGKEYNGTFDFTLRFNQVMLIFSIPAGLMIPVSWFLVKDTPVQEGQRRSLRQYLRQAWALMTHKAVFMVVMWNFWEAVIGRINTTASGLVKSEWAGVKNFQNQLFSLVSLMVFSYGLHIVKKRFLHCSWRKMLLGTGIFLNVMDGTLAFLTTYDIVRNQYFYLGEQILDDIPAAANFVIGTFIVVELADQGVEGLTYGLLTTVANLGNPFSRAIGNQIFGLFRPNLSDSANYRSDTPEFRNTVALSFLLSYGFSFASFLLLLLIPDQKEEAQRRKKAWGSRSTYGVITIVLLAFAMSYALTINFMTMIPATACLEVVGGSGC
mmetsp:Transcript_32765/g.76572  ORF Transcript_32765/g.76572 Transcript_32765/m.76572 type:complete len:579 (+) Transcript_32765:76-1812(+)